MSSTPTSASGSGYGLPAGASVPSSSSSSAAPLAGGASRAISPSGLPLPPNSTASASASATAAAQQAAPASSAPRPRFDTEALSAFLKTHLAAKLGAPGVVWNRSDKEATRALTTQLAQTIKSKMLELAPRSSAERSGARGGGSAGFKFVVYVQLVENLGQGGRGDMACHWEESDQVVQELYSNDRILCTVTCFAIRAY